jgi:hypothetical protein
MGRTSGLTVGLVDREQAKALLPVLGLLHIDQVPDLRTSHGRGVGPSVAGGVRADAHSSRVPEYYVRAELLGCVQGCSAGLPPPVDTPRRAVESHHSPSAAREPGDIPKGWPSQRRIPRGNRGFYHGVLQHLPKRMETNEGPPPRSRREAPDFWDPDFWRIDIHPVRGPSCTPGVNTWRHAVQRGSAAP